MKPFLVQYDILAILDNIDALTEQLEQARNSRANDGTADAEAIEQQIDAYEDTIESLEWDLSQIVEEIVKDLKNNESDARAMEYQEKAFAKKKQVAQARANRDEGLLKFIMQSKGERKVKGELFTVSIVKNGGKRGLDLRVAPEELPEQFRTEKVVYSPNQDAIRAALDSGYETNLFAYKPQGEHVSIK